MPPVLSKCVEKNNYYRFNFALHDVGTKCVRKEFDKQFHPSKLTEVLNKNRQTLEKHTTSDQKNLLYPSSHEKGKQPVTSQMLDITLMICILKNVAKLDIGDKFPLENKVGVTDDLTRLKWYRNKFCHSSQTEINDNEFDKFCDDILKVVERLGDPGWKEECERILRCSICSLLNEMKYILLQLFIILHTKGYKICNKVSKEFWSYSVPHQLHFILSLFEFHFWLYPPIYVLWNEYQDSYHENADIKFFRKTECQSDKHGLGDDNCNKSYPAATGTEAMNVPHTIEIECQDCPYIIKRAKHKEGTVTTNNIIKMVCTCTQGLVAAELCYTTLFAMLDPRRYRHDQNPTNATHDYNDHYLIYKVRDNIYEADKIKGVKDKEILSTEIGTLGCFETKETLTEVERRELKIANNAGIWFSPRNSSVQYVSATNNNTFSFNTTGNGLCNRACGGQLR